MDSKKENQVLKTMVKSIANNRAFVGSRLIAKFAKLYLDHHHNCLGDIYTSGEVDILRVLGEQVEFKTIFDIGANVGQWSIEAHKHFPKSSIYAFEIVPGVFEKFKVNTQHLGDKLHAYNFGLAESAREMEIDAYQDTGLTSVLDLSSLHTTVTSSKVSIKLKRGDDFCSSQNITSIDFMKVDVEGTELSVLRGFQKLLENGGVKIIQFEYNLANVYSRTYLKDFYEYFTPLGYLIARIYRRNVEFMDYNPHYEFIGHGNYLMVHKTQSDILEALKHPLL